MANIQIFESSELGTVRTAGDWDNPTFCLADVRKVLGLSANGNLTARLSEDGIATLALSTPGGTQQATFINEANLYLCIFQSRKPVAKKFQAWVAGEVLPAIRRRGVYEIEQRVRREVEEAVRQADVPRYRQRISELEALVTQLVTASVALLQQGRQAPGIAECISPDEFARQLNAQAVAYFSTNQVLCWLLYQGYVSSARGRRTVPSDYAIRNGWMIEIPHGVSVGADVCCITPMGRQHFLSELKKLHSSEK